MTARTRSRMQDHQNFIASLGLGLEKAAPFELAASAWAIDESFLSSLPTFTEATPPLEPDRAGSPLTALSPLTLADASPDEVIAPLPFPTLSPADLSRDVSPYIEPTLPPQLSFVEDEPTSQLVAEDAPTPRTRRSKRGRSTEDDEEFAPDDFDASFSPDAALAPPPTKKRRTKTAKAGFEPIPVGAPREKRDYSLGASKTSARAIPAGAKKAIIELEAEAAANGWDQEQLETAKAQAIETFRQRNADSARRSRAAKAATMAKLEAQIADRDAVIADLRRQLAAALARAS